MLRRDACFFGGGDPAERYGIEKDMSDRKWENQNGENAPERERVYAPTHAGSGTLNLRPFQKHGAPETDTEVIEAVMRLPEKYKSVIYLFYIAGYKTQEIASILSVSPSAVRKRLQYGRERLRLEL